MTKLEYTHSDIIEIDADARLAERNRLLNSLRRRLDELDEDPTVDADPELNGYRNGLRYAIHLINSDQKHLD